VALLAALPGVRDRFLAPHNVAVENRQGEITFHEVVGLSEAVPGVQPGAPLDEWLHVALLNGLSVAAVDSAVPTAIKKMSSGAKKAADLKELENGSEIGSTTGGDGTSDHRTPTISRSSKESAGSKRSSLMGANNSIMSLRAVLTFRYQARAKVAQKVVRAALQELMV
jgi:hypothetical protein